jgi:hypothetical protein
MSDTTVVRIVPLDNGSYMLQRYRPDIGDYVNMHVYTGNDALKRAQNRARTYINDTPQR